jgi:hypothetical protein
MFKMLLTLTNVNKISRVFLGITSAKTEKGPTILSGLFDFCFLTLRRDYILGLRTFLPLGNGKFYALAFFQGAISIAVDCTVVHKNVIAAFALDKTEAFAGVEPFYSADFAICHDFESPF